MLSAPIATLKPQVSEVASVSPLHLVHLTCTLLESEPAGACGTAVAKHTTPDGAPGGMADVHPRARLRTCCHRARECERSNAEPLPQIACKWPGQGVARGVICRHSRTDPGSSRLEDTRCPGVTSARFVAPPRFSPTRPTSCDAPSAAPWSSGRRSRSSAVTAPGTASGQAGPRQPAPGPSRASRCGSSPHGGPLWAGSSLTRCRCTSTRCRHRRAVRLARGRRLGCP